MASDGEARAAIKCEEGWTAVPGTTEYDCACGKRLDNYAELVNHLSAAKWALIGLLRVEVARLTERLEAADAAIDEERRAAKRHLRAAAAEWDEQNATLRAQRDELAAAAIAAESAGMEAVELCATLQARLKALEPIVYRLESYWPDDQAAIDTVRRDLRTTLSAPAVPAEKP